MYPTRVSDILNIKTDMDVAAIYIHSMTGALVLKNLVNSDNITINVSGFANGQYLVTVATTDGKLHTQKILKY